MTIDAPIPNDVRHFDGALLSKEWFSIADLAAERLPGLPGSRGRISQIALEQGWHLTDKARKRSGRGGGVEYHYLMLPDAAKIELMLRYGPKPSTEQIKEWQARMDAFLIASPGAQKCAQIRLEILDAIERQVCSGLKRAAAIHFCAVEYGVAKSSIYAWEKLLRGVPDRARLAYLVPSRRGPKPATR